MCERVKFNFKQVRPRQDAGYAPSIQEREIPLLDSYSIVTNFDNLTLNSMFTLLIEVLCQFDFEKQSGIRDLRCCFVYVCITHCPSPRVWPHLRHRDFS